MSGRAFVVRRAAGRNFRARMAKQADGGGLGTYNFGSRSPRQESQATTPICGAASGTTV